MIMLLGVLCAGLGPVRRRAACPNLDRDGWFMLGALLLGYSGEHL
jgi:hypothetical protein